MVTRAASESRAISSSRAITASPVVTSSAPVGSSARIRRGRRTRARATATRCCSPPDSRVGSWWARSARPTRSSISMAERSRRQNCRAVPYIIGIITFSSAVRRSSRLNCWNTKPMEAPRSRARRASDSRDTSRPSNSSSPVVCRSISPSRFSRVVLPDPDRPTTATWSPVSTVRSTPWRMCSISRLGRRTERVRPRSLSSGARPSWGAVTTSHRRTWRPRGCPRRARTAGSPGPPAGPRRSAPRPRRAGPA